jgi:DNA replication protein DnaC
LATTDYGEAVDTKCGRCGEPFRYTPVRIEGKIVVRRTLCDRCADEDNAAEQRDQLQLLQDDAEQRALRRLELLDRITGNAAECRAMTFDSFDCSECGPKPLDAAREFTRDVIAAGPHDGVRGLYLWGDFGTGKTHLVVAVLDELLRRDDFDAARIQFDRADELILQIQDTYNTQQSTMAVADLRKRAGVWILDDLGTEQPSADAGRHLRQILSRRVLKPTLITSNLSPEQLQDQNPELGRVVSRLGRQYFRVVEVKGRDRRGSR